VYSWGRNNAGQIGNYRLRYEEYQLTPFKLSEFASIVKLISCGCELSMAQTVEDIIYVWGFYYSNFPIQLKIGAKIDKMSCGSNYCLFLSTDGELHLFGENNYGQTDGQTEDFDAQFKLTKLDSQIKFKNIASHSLSNVMAAQSKEGNYYIWGEIQGKKLTVPEVTTESSFDDIFIKYCEITYKVIRGEFRFILEDNFIINNKYSSNYTQLKKIGSGAYGTVFKAKLKNERLVAVKKMNFEINSRIRKEYEIFLSISKLRSPSIVEYIDTWFEDHVENSNKVLRMYIHMDCCETNLSNIIEEIKSNPVLSSGGVLTPVCYYTGCILFAELLGALNFLHKNKIIHCDLKPDNILLKNKDKGFIKIGDFGLASFHEFNKTHKANKGTEKYIAPEVRNCNASELTHSNYDTKADIYSLGVIYKDLFLLDINK
jgi:hypothetical protein